MATNSRKCANCDHDLFTTFDKTEQKWYCQPCHPDKVRIIRERREYEDILLGIANNELTRDEKDRLTIFYEKILDNKNNTHNNCFLFIE